MGPLTLLPALVFTAVVFLVLLEGLHVAARAWRRQPLRRRDRLWGGLALAGLACIGEGALVEPFWPEVVHVTIATPRLPPGQRLRLVQLSDLHCDATARLEGRLPALVAAERPQAIVFCGDAVNDAAGVVHLRPLLAALARIAPTYAVRGNWDDDPDLTGLVAGTGVVELRGDRAVRLPGRAEAWLAGAPFAWVGTIDRALDRLPATGLRVFAYHMPDDVELVRSRADLFLAGHTHGGQVRLPLYGALVTMSSLGKRYEAGRYDLGATTLYVTRGIGMEGGFAPRVRFWCRPEVTVLDLVGR